MTTNEELINKINAAATIIANKSRTNSANYIIVSPKIAKILEELDTVKVLRKLRKEKLEQIFKNKKTL